MARTKCVIVYSIYQRLRRRLIIPHDDSLIPNYVAPYLLPGEAAIVCTLTDYRTYGSDKLLAMRVGAATTKGRCAVVGPSGKVVAVVHADPRIDRHPSGRLHHDPNAKAVVGQLAAGLALLPC